MGALIPAILSGGSGTRLWPLSRRAFPKQFHSLASNATLLQDTIRRAKTIPGISDPIVVAGEEHRFLVVDQLKSLREHGSGENSNAIILEPAGRNTAASVAVAALYARSLDPAAVLLVLPADHTITNLTAFHECVAVAANAAEQGLIVTFGIIPSYPETGFGYIEVGELLHTSCHRVRRFIEKPDPDTAASYIDRGLLWNSGMLVTKAGRYLEELGKFQPEILKAVEESWSERIEDGEFFHLAPESFLKCPDISLDRAILELSSRAAVVPAELGWSDLGTWSSLWEKLRGNVDGNVILGDVISKDMLNSLVRADSRLVCVAGLSDVIVIETSDAVLITKRDKPNHLKNIVSQLETEKRPELEYHRRVYRPWGYYECIDSGTGFQVKRLMVKPGGALSLQLHHKRAEHWVVISGIALVTSGNREFRLGPNESTYIPPGRKHRLENSSDDEPLHLIEVQSGDYLGEDDIVRFDDRYKRT